MEPYIKLLTALASFLIVIRLSTFKAEGKCQRLGIAAIAWITIILSGAQGIHILFFAAPVSISTLGLTLILLFLVLRTKGNMAHLLRIKHDMV